MCDDARICAAEELVFGTPPESVVSRIGYDMAMRYYAPLIDRMERVLNDNAAPDAALAFSFEKAMTFPYYAGFDRFPEETRAMIRQCGRAFQRRYAPLLPPEVRAA